MYWPGIEVMTIHFLHIICPFNCLHFQRPLPVSASVTPVHSKMGAPQGKLGIVPICKGGPKQTFDLFAYCILPTIVNILELSILVSFYTVNKANLRDLIAATSQVISNWSQIINFSTCVTVKFDGWPRKTIGHFFYTTFNEFKLHLQSRNAQLGSKLVICYPVWPWNLMDDLGKQ